MYNGIGLSSVRGTATSGYIQTNRGHVRNSRVRHQRERNQQQSQSAAYHPVSAAARERGNVELQEHDRRRRLENHLLEMREELESTTELPVEEIDKRILQERSMLIQLWDQSENVKKAAKEAQLEEGMINDDNDKSRGQNAERHQKNPRGSAFLSSSRWGPRVGTTARSATNSHLEAELKAKENDKLRDAFGISSENHVEGAAFDRDLQEQKRNERLLEKERKQKEEEKAKRKLARDVLRVKKIADRELNKLAVDRAKDRDRRKGNRSYFTDSEDDGKGDRRVTSSRPSPRKENIQRRSASSSHSSSWSSHSSYSSRSDDVRRGRLPRQRGGRKVRGRRRRSASSSGSASTSSSRSSSTSSRSLSYSSESRSQRDRKRLKSGSYDKFKAIGRKGSHDGKKVSASMQSTLPPPPSKEKSKPSERGSELSRSPSLSDSRSSRSRSSSGSTSRSRSSSSESPSMVRARKRKPAPKYNQTSSVSSRSPSPRRGLRSRSPRREVVKRKVAVKSVSNVPGFPRSLPLGISSRSRSLERDDGVVETKEKARPASSEVAGARRSSRSISASPKRGRRDGRLRSLSRSLSPKPLKGDKERRRKESLDTGSRSRSPSSQSRSDSSDRGKPKRSGRPAVKDESSNLRQAETFAASQKVAPPASPSLQEVNKQEQSGATAISVTRRCRRRRHDDDTRKSSSISPSRSVLSGGSSRNRSSSGSHSRSRGRLEKRPRSESNFSRLQRKSGSRSASRSLSRSPSSRSASRSQSRSRSRSASPMAATKSHGKGSSDKPDNDKSSVVARRGSSNVASLKRRRSPSSSYSRSSRSRSFSRK